MSLQRKLLVGAAALALGTAVYLGFDESKSGSSLPTTGVQREYEISFSEAKRDEKVRQKYIDRIVKKHPLPISGAIACYNNDVAYYPSLLPDGVTATSGVTIIRTHYYVPEHSEGVVQNIKVEVSRGAFDGNNSDDEFLSCFNDHEYVHLRFLTNEARISLSQEAVPELQSRVFDIRGDLHVILQELYAYDAQIRAFPTRNLNSKFKHGIIEMYNNHIKLAEDLEQSKGQTPLTKWILESFPKR